MSTYGHKQSSTNKLYNFSQFLRTIIKLTLSCVMTSVPTHTHPRHTHTLTHKQTQTSSTSSGRGGFAKPGSSAANPHSLRMNSMIACHRHQPPRAPPAALTFTPLSHMYRPAPPPPPHTHTLLRISDSTDGESNKLLPIAAAASAASLSGTPTTPVSANQGLFIWE